MLIALVSVHVVICLCIIGLILLQSSQQSNLGGMFGGGASQTVFGSGTQTALGKATTWLAIGFFVLCILISFVVEKQRSFTKMTEIRSEKIGEIAAPAGEGAQAPAAIPSATPSAEPAQPAE